MLLASCLPSWSAMHDVCVTCAKKCAVAMGVFVWPETKSQGYQSFEWLPVYCGVPQGSLLGQLPFNIFINDLNFPVQVSFLRLCVDDTTAYATNSNVSALELSLNQDLETLLSWTACNHLSVNKRKAHAMVLRNIPRESVFYTGHSAVEISCYLKILGVHIDNKLSFKDYLSTV